MTATITQSGSPQRVSEKECFRSDLPCPVSVLCESTPVDCLTGHGPDIAFMFAQAAEAPLRRQGSDVLAVRAAALVVPEPARHPPDE
ncbi:hypothetical protein Tdes44962_MAKER02295 [Teratosphaeria destructans]|uniref:Uncharacterized protein n=1 Tax=Teratosphaeria destructans TaxID=418781 RepID=A0A9W7SUC0_9PEZI|nr:hypothetical protein Tdes44962_MAKER02295 [Teratosphaeria destructans]